MACQAAKCDKIPMIQVPFNLCCASGASGAPSLPRPVRFHTPEEEIAMGPACWLWDYLRRSGASGYLLPLSGGEAWRTLLATSSGNV
jgi:NAD+ synthase (glutamine-hydrolysing)